MIEIARTEAGREVTPMAASAIVGTAAGDYIVGQYSADGRKTKHGTTLGDTNTSARIKSKLLEFMERKGEKSVIEEITKEATKKRRVKQTKKNSNITSSYPELEVTAEVIQVDKPKPNIVVFLIPRGKIKVIANAVLESDKGLMLVFANEDEVRYIPEAGDTLELSINNNKYSVMYLGFNFNWYAGPQILMPFMKVDESDK